MVHKNIVSFDIETDPQGNLVMIGVNNNGRYLWFGKADEFWQYLKRNKIKEVWAHNLEFDFFKVYEYLPEIKFCGYYSTAGLSYVQAGNIFFKDLYNHLPYPLEYIGHLINLKKLEIDYAAIKTPTKKLIEYNKRDCEIVYRSVKRLWHIYKQFGCKAIKSTTGSQAMDIYMRNFICYNLKKIPDQIIERWREGYRGGWVDVFKSGYYDQKTFYKIDVNSLFPFMMLGSLPYPYYYYTTRSITDQERYYRFWLGFTFDPEREKYDVINSIEHRDMIAEFYTVFPRRTKPFKEYVKHIFKKRTRARSLFNKKVFKRLMNGLYGKFAQKSELDVVSNYHYKKTAGIFYSEEITDDLYRIKFAKKNKFWVNVVWSSFITAKAREYMFNMLRYIKRKRLDVYYIDTDAFIVSGDIEKIKGIINNKKLGLFKIEEMSNLIDIRGKKFYRFGDQYKCKGVPEKYRKEFFENDEVQFKKMVRYKEGLARHIRIGSWIGTKKENKKNKPLTNNK